MLISPLIKTYQQLIKPLLSFITVITAVLLFSLFASNVAWALTAGNQSSDGAQAPTPAIQTEKDILVVGSEQDYPPFATGLTDATAGGFTVDLWKAVAAEAGLKYTIRVLPFHELLKEFKAGKIDVLINLATSKERHVFADFTVPHAIVHGGIFVRKGESNISSEADLAGKSIIVLNADLAHDYAISKGWEKQLVLVDTAAEGMRLLASGRHDAMLLSKLAGMQTLQALGLTNVKALKVNAGFSQKFTFAVQKGNAELLSKLNEGLAITKSNGTYDALYEKWFGIYKVKEVGWRDLLKYLLPILFVFLCIAQYLIYRRKIERKAAQKALQESEAHLRLSQISGGIGTWEADLVNHTQKWSENCTALLGISTKSNPTWDDFLALVHPEDRQRIIDATQSHIEHGTPYDVEYRVVTTIKQVHWMRSTGQVEFDANGKPIFMRGITQDITARKLAEQALQKSEHTLSVVLENVDAYIFLKDIQGRYLYANRKVCDLFGTSLEAIVGQGDERFFDAETVEQIRNNDRQVLLEGKTLRTEETNRKIKSGFASSYLVVKLPLRNESGEIYALCGISTEITELKLMEMQLVKNISLLNATLESTNDAILAVDLNNNWLSHNQRFIDLWHITDDMIAAKDDDAALAYMLNQLEDADAFLNKVSELYAMPEAISFDTFKFKSGKIIERYSKPQLVEGKVAGRVCSFRDVTERVQSEALVVESRNLLMSIIDTAPVEVFWKDRDSRYLGCNTAYAISAGLKHPEEIVGKLDSELLWADKAECYRADDLVVMETGIAKLNYEQSLTMQNGETRWDSASKLPLKNKNNETIGLLGVETNITERKQIEQDLLENEFRWKFAIESTGDCMWDTNEVNQTIIFYNDSEEMASYSEDDVISSLEKWESCIHPDDKIATLASVQDCLDGNASVYVSEYRALRKDGSYKWILDRGKLVSRTADGKPLRMIGTSSDITERKNAESLLQAAQNKSELHNVELRQVQSELVESRDRYRDLYEFAPIGYLSVSNHGLISNINWKATAMFGLSRKELNGRRLAEFIADEDKERWQRMFISLRKLISGEDISFDLKFVNKDGSIFDINLTCLRMDDEVDQPILRIALTDVTQLKQAEAKLINSESYLRSIIDNEPECIKIVDARGYLKQMNPAGLAMIEADTLEQVAGRLVLDVIAPEHHNAFNNLHKRVLAGESVQMEFEVIGLKGGRHWVETHAVPMQDHGKMVQLAVTHDITERKQAENELRIAAIAFEAQEGMLITDPSGKILKVNRAFTSITGYNAGDVLGKNPSILSSGQHDADFYNAMWKSIDNMGGWNGEIWNKRKNGEAYPEHLNITAVKDEIGVVTNYVATLTDITMSKAAAEEIQLLAFYDPLTRLPNRRLLVDRLNQALVSSARNGVGGALLFMDLDHFKTLNDTLGHDIGDLLLQQVAERLTACVREGDTVSRLGGDEYVVMLEHLSEQTIEAAAQAEAVGEKILAALNQPYQLASFEYSCTASIGITLFSDHNQSQEDLLKHADIAMYQAKKEGRNAMRFFDPKMQDVIDARVSLEGDLRKALENNEFQLYYQVQVDNTDQPLGAEALIRWHQPKRGLVSPFDFIPLAEETGLILPIGLWVLDTACAQLKAWEQNELTRDLTISVNVSAKQFNQADFVTQVQTIVQNYAINPILLKLELTESMLINHLDNIIITMVALQAIGVRFELDDFGTGYSSLQYLKQLPLHQLKIDQSFIRDIASDTSDQAIVCTIIAIAQSLNLAVIAEGVETEQQRQFLLSNGCNHYQGYLFSKPVPAEKFEELLKQV